MTEGQHRDVAAGELGMLGELLPLVAPAHLHLVRATLRHPGRWSGLGPGIASVRADLLDACCRRLAAGNAASEEYYRAVGDMHPDLSALEDARGAE